MKFKIVPIAGDASFRKFYRIFFDNKKKIIVTSEKEKYNNLLAYSAINKFLRLKKLNTPKLYDHNYSKGIIIIEDFGDLPFNKIISKNKNKFKIYKKLVDLLLKIQKIRPPKKIKIFNKKFNFKKKYSNKYFPCGVKIEENIVDLSFAFSISLVIIFCRKSFVSDPFI